MAISSNASIAGNVSASFSRAASALNNIRVSPISSRINVAGNGPAEQSLPAFQNGLKTLSVGIVSAGENIHSVAKDFERIDQNFAQQTGNNLPGGF
jgi:type VII secretion effector (TIGR04197 family)